jgi:hypothetical protein
MDFSGNILVEGRLPPSNLGVAVDGSTMLRPDVEEKATYHGEHSSEPDGASLFRVFTPDIIEQVLVL